MLEPLQNWLQVIVRAQRRHASLAARPDEDENGWVPRSAEKNISGKEACRMSLVCCCPSFLASGLLAASFSGVDTES